jgi:hypothetical protein
MLPRKALIPADRTLAGIGLTFLVGLLRGRRSVRAFARASLTCEQFDEWVKPRAMREPK